MNKHKLALLTVFVAVITQAIIPPASVMRARRLDAPTSRGQAPGDEKWAVWNRGTYLRGANVWLKRKGDAIYPAYTPQDLGDLAGWGANYVNISYPGVYNEKPHRHAPRYGTEKKVLDRLHELVGWAATKHLYVVIAFRTGPQSFEQRFDESNPPPEKLWSDPEAQSEWVNMWRDTAREFAGEKAVVGYDLMVEPDTGAHQALWLDLAKKIIASVREVDPATPILVEPADGGGADALTALDPKSLDPKGDLRIVYCAHQYVPEVYTQQTEGKWEYDCGRGMRDKKGRPKPEDYVAYSEERAAALKGVYQRLGAWKDAKKVPVAVNEFGVIRWAGGWREGKPAPDADRFMADQLELIEGLGLNYAVWKWDPAECLGDDDFNFRHGQLFEQHADVESALSDVIRSHWRSVGTRR